MLRAAKETISLAEQRLLEDDKRQFDSAWQEMLNHATQRVRVSLCPWAGAPGVPAGVCVRVPCRGACPPGGGGGGGGQRPSRFPGLWDPACPLLWGAPRGLLSQAEETAFEARGLNRSQSHRAGIEVRR